MVKIAPISTKDTELFREVTDQLFSSVPHEEFAEALDCSVALIRQARRDPKSPAFRNPPDGWQGAARRIAEDRAAHFTKLAAKLSRPKG
jgi:hypothetical protein